MVNDTVKGKEKLLLDLIKNDSNITIKDISVKLGVSKSTANRGISRKGADKSGNWIIIN